MSTEEKLVVLDELIDYLGLKLFPHQKELLKKCVLDDRHVYYVSGGHVALCF